MLESTKEKLSKARAYLPSKKTVAVGTSMLVASVVGGFGGKVHRYKDSMAFIYNEINLSQCEPALYESRQAYIWILGEMRNNHPNLQSIAEKLFPNSVPSNSDISKLVRNNASFNALPSLVGE